MAKKFIMPKTVKIGGLVYKVVYPYVFPDDGDALGIHCFSEGTLKITDIYRDKKRVNFSIHQTLLHEITHGIDFVYCGDSIESDADIDRLAAGWYDVLTENDLKLKKLGFFPKNVKVGGYKYTVEYPYKVVDSRHTYMVSFESGLIKIYGNKPVSPYAEKHAFISALLYIIRHHFSIDEPFNNGNGDSTLFSSLASGFHQVLIDNDIERIIKSGK